MDEEDKFLERLIPLTSSLLFLIAVQGRKKNVTCCFVLVSNLVSRIKGRTLQEQGAEWNIST